MRSLTRISVRATNETHRNDGLMVGDNVGALVGSSDSLIYQIK